MMRSRDTTELSYFSSSTMSSTLSHLHFFFYGHRSFHSVEKLSREETLVLLCEEWKNNFRKTLGPFLNLPIFPDDVHHAVHHYLSNPDAATCSNVPLSVVLAKYDRHSHPGIVLLETIHDGWNFIYGKEKFSDCHVV